MGTKVKSIRFVGGDHEVDCKRDAGSFMLKACFLKKARASPFNAPTVNAVIMRPRTISGTG